MSESDFEAWGALDGLEGEAREARVALLAELVEQGFGEPELRAAAREGRLVLLPVERVLSGEGERLTADEVAERSGVERAFLDRQLRSLGLAVPADDEAVYTERDLEAAERVAALRAAGLPDEGILEISRLLGMSMSQLAAANRSLIANAFVAEGDSELETARRLAAAAEGFMPLMGESLAYVLNVHLREQIRHDALVDGEPAADGAQPTAFGFVDIVGFTQLGETLEPEALGGVTGRLSELAADAIEPPVRLVKMIGDAAMIAGPEPEAVVETVHEMLEAAEREGESFPMLRGGVAFGPAIARGGDWYGRPVNLASRITDRARPGSVLASEEVRDALDSSYRWSFAGAKRLKGFDAEVKLYRCRRATDEP